jgi:hypothetical protein
VRCGGNFRGKNLSHILIPSIFHGSETIQPPRSSPNFLKYKHCFVADTALSLSVSSLPALGGHDFGLGGILLCDGRPLAIFKHGLELFPCSFHVGLPTFAYFSHFFRRFDQLVQSISQTQQTVIWGKKRSCILGEETSTRPASIAKRQPTVSTENNLHSIAIGPGQYKLSSAPTRP